MFKDKTLLITGGTGSFGNAVLNRFLETDIGEIRIFSRDEKKQDDMRHLYNNTKIKYARTTVCTKNFDPQTDLLRFNATDFHMNFARLMQLGQEFIEMKPDSPQIF